MSDETNDKREVPAPQETPADDIEPVHPAGRSAQAPVKARGGRLLASLALLLSLATLGAAGYLYYEYVHLDRLGLFGSDDRWERVTGDLAALETRLAELSRQQSAAFEAVEERARAARRATEEALRESLAEVARQAPPSTSEWRRAEVRYLLRIANHRLLLERDVAGALDLLHAADAILAELDDFALHEVRARLADEMAALAGVEGIDLQGMFLRLEALKRELDRLPLRVPEYLVAETEAAPGDDSFWGVLGDEIGGYLRLRRFDGAVKPLLAPEEAVYLELNLRLMLERAQLAAVRREQLLFEESLATAAEWVERYLDGDDRAVQHLLSELRALQAVDLAQPLPDISGSLNALNAVLRSAA